VQNKNNRRWTWYVLDHRNGQIVAFVLGRRTDATFRKLKGLLKRAGIKVKRWLCDSWGTYLRCLKPGQRRIGKDLTRQIEHKNLDFRTRIKRLQRRTIGFSKSVLMHDTLIAYFINTVFWNL